MSKRPKCLHEEIEIQKVCETCGHREPYSPTLADVLTREQIEITLSCIKYKYDDLVQGNRAFDALITLFEEARK